MIKTVDIKSMSYEECRNLFASLGEPAYRADQVLEWLHGRQVTSYDEMTNLPASLRRALVNGQVKMGLNGHEKSPQMAIELKK